jgi:hypothetical protein
MTGDRITLLFRSNWLVILTIIFYISFDFVQLLVVAVCHEVVSVYYRLYTADQDWKRIFFYITDLIFGNFVSTDYFTGSTDLKVKDFHEFHFTDNICMHLQNNVLTKHSNEKQCNHYHC